MKLLASLVVCFAILFMANCGFAKETPVAKNKQDNKRNKASDSLEGKKCCTNYSDIRKLISDVEKVQVPKERGEFETTEQFNKRVNESSDKAVTDSCYLFLLDQKTGWAKYDADRQVMNFGITVTSPIVLHKDVDTGQFIGSNAFGVKKVITKTSVNEFCINSVEVSNKVLSRQDKFNSRYIMLDGLKTGIETAKDIKNKYAILILVKPKKSNDGSSDFRYINYKSFHIKATIDSPHEEQSASVLLNAVILEAIVVDTSNGNVLQQKVLADHSPCLDKFIITD